MRGSLVLFMIIGGAGFISCHASAVSHPHEFLFQAGQACAAAIFVVSLLTLLFGRR
ncbi:MAG TPA: hypothetical protein VGG25_08205 [Streptosporangiaceae bacterium]|jgi:hypothetical protein